MWTNKGRDLRFFARAISVYKKTILIQRSLIIDDSEWPGTWSSPSLYDQPGGRGQLLSRRYFKHSVWLLLCAYITASSSHGALAVSCKYFKQSK